MRKVLLTVLFLIFGLFSIIVVPNARAQQTTQNPDTVMILPFENTSGRPEFNWVGESFAAALSDLLKVPGLNVVSNEERKIIQQRLQVPLTTLPSLATSLKLARESRATLLISGKYNIVPAQGEVAAAVSVTSKIIRVNEGRFLSEELPDGRKITRDINLSDALANLQTVEGQLAYQILYQRDKALPFSQNQFVETANKIPSRAFEAYIKGLLTPESDSQSRENFFKNAMRIYSEDEKTKGGTYAAAALELGHFYLSQRKFTEAVDYFSRVPAEDEHYAEAAFYTGLIYWQQNNFEQALAVLRPLAEDLKLTSVYNTLGAIAVQASLAEKKNKQKAAALLNEGLEMLKKSAESAPEDAQSRFNYGYALFLNNNFAEAAQNLRPALAARPTDGEAYFLLAKSLEKTGDATAADFDNQARRFLPNYAKYETEWTRSKSVDASLRIQQPPRKDFVSVVITRRQSAPVQAQVSETEALLTEARNFYKAGRDDDAMKSLRRVLASEPMSAEAYLLLGSIHLRRGDMEQAVSSLKTALFWDNRLIEAYVALGRIFLEKNDCLQALNYSRSALEIDQNHQDAVALQRQVERCSK
ncbi:MAG: tetratricopeptide repeat protein [Acidobacteriota bacterium]|nr:tetratricopeptide repeat protein [Acidobacteriota bacterium]